MPSSIAYVQMTVGMRSAVRAPRAVTQQDPGRVHLVLAPTGLTGRAWVVGVSNLGDAAILLEENAVPCSNNLLGAWDIHLKGRGV